mmetsp:Transcript_53230/g.155003  ORF Transcript_53230/g.155003 Transcript_53230/m.155003 type:complete len:305 (+) Transcript_53230:310-1224(+)
MHTHGPPQERLDVAYVVPPPLPLDTVVLLELHPVHLQEEVWRIRKDDQPARRLAPVLRRSGEASVRQPAMRHFREGAAEGLRSLQPVLNESDALQLVAWDLCLDLQQSLNCLLHHHRAAHQRLVAKDAATDVRQGYGGKAVGRSCSQHRPLHAMSEALASIQRAALPEPGHDDEKDLLGSHTQALDDHRVAGLQALLGHVGALVPGLGEGLLHQLLAAAVQSLEGQAAVGHEVGGHGEHHGLCLRLKDVSVHHLQAAIRLQFHLSHPAPVLPRQGGLRGHEELLLRRLPRELGVAEDQARLVPV